jgi:hypothetical protein
VVVRRIAAGLSAVCVALALVTVWAPALIPAQDAPLYHFAIEVIRAPQRFAGYVEWAIPVSGGALQLAGGSVLAFVEPTAALKLLLSLALAALVLGTRRLAALAGSPWPLPVALSAALFVGFSYAMGFFNFLSGACLALLAGSVWLASPPSATVGARARQAALWLVAVYVHAVATALLALPLLAVGWLHWGARACLGRAVPLVPAGVQN